MNLYAVSYDYVRNTEDVDSIEVERDQWFIACENEDAVHKTMERNKMAFATVGYDLREYSFRKVDKTDNGHPIFIGFKGDEFIN